MKKCNNCGKIKLLTNFYKALHKEARCKECVSKIRKESYKLNPEKALARVKKYRNENPEKIRDCKLRQAYGVGIKYFDAKLKEQDNSCGACKQNVKTKWRGKEVSMALDHDHKTGKARGVLCIKCNRALGLLEDNQETIMGLLEYIRKYQK
jgi:Autographiviridae endonuclease VII